MKQAIEFGGTTLHIDSSEAPREPYAGDVLHCMDIVFAVGDPTTAATAAIVLECRSLQQAEDLSMALRKAVVRMRTPSK